MENIKLKGLKVMDSNNLHKFFDKIRAISSPYRRDLMYGRNAILRKLANYPFPLPFRFILEHGVDAVQVDIFESTANPYGYFVYSSEKAQRLKEIGKKNVYQIPDPFTYVVNEEFKKFIPQVELKNSRDTNKLLFFFAHSTDSVIDTRNRDEYLKVIKEYSKDYDVTVCLHFSDVKRNVGEFLSDNSIKWTSITEFPRYDFPYKFFKMVDNFGKVVSTLPGSYLYYCNYINIPFELVNLPPTLTNLSDKAQDKDFVGFFDEYPNSTAYKLFTGDCDSVNINSQQKQFVNKLLGYNSKYSDGRSVKDFIKKELWNSIL